MIKMLVIPAKDRMKPIKSAVKPTIRTNVKYIDNLNLKNPKSIMRLIKIAYLSFFEFCSFINKNCIIVLACFLCKKQ